MPEKILVVDDDTDSLKLIGLMLKRQGYEVIAANAGQPALQKAYAEQPDLIILDVMMPDLSGYEVTKRLREEPTTADIPIIMFTAKTLVDDKVAGFEAGVDDYLTKPTHPAELASRVKAVLGRRQSARNVSGAGAQGLSMGFLGVKGGVGTTTLAASMGALYAKSRSTVLVDIRPGQGTLGLQMGATRAQSLAAVLSQPMAQINQQLLQDHIAQHSSGLYMLLSSINPQEVQLNYSLDALSELYRQLQGMFDYQLYDLGAGLNRVNVRLLREVERLVFVIEPNEVAVLLGRSILEELQNLGMGAGKISLVIANRAQSNLQMPWQEVESALNHEVSAIISPAPDIAYQAAEANAPITSFQPESIIAGQISKLAEELTKRGG
ncbi:MAG: response regulator [Anaerolineales bacterium]